MKKNVKPPVTIEPSALYPSAMYPSDAATIIARTEQMRAHLDADDPRHEYQGLATFAHGWKESANGKIVLLHDVRLAVLVTYPHPDDVGGISAIAGGWLAVHWERNPITKLFVGGPDLMHPSDLKKLIIAPKTAAKPAQTPPKIKPKQPRV